MVLFVSQVPNNRNRILADIKISHRNSETEFRYFGHSLQDNVERTKIIENTLTTLSCIALYLWYGKYTSRIYSTLLYYNSIYQIVCCICIRGENLDKLFGALWPPRPPMEPLLIQQPSEIFVFTYKLMISYFCSISRIIHIILFH